MKKTIKTILFVTGFLIVLVILSGFLYITKGLETERQPELNGIDLAQVEDGTYTGRYKAGRFTNEVAVTVSGGKITGIQIVDDVTFADQHTSDTLFQRITAQQSTSIDIVSGATVTSHAYLKAIENALNGQP